MKLGLKNQYIITLDDDPTMGQLVSAILAVKALSFADSESLLKNVSRYHPLAVFVDFHLGNELKGIQVIPELRRRWPYTPIIVVTADPTVEAIREALACGADDFIQKPFRPGELIARFQSRLNQLSQKLDQSRTTVADITIDASCNQIISQHGTRTLSPTSVRALLALARARGSLVSREALKTYGWGKFVVSDNAVDRKISEIRSVLKEMTERVEILSVYGKGFILSLLDQTGPTKA